MNTTGSLSNTSATSVVPLWLKYPVNWFIKKLTQAGVTQIIVQLPDAKSFSIGEPVNQEAVPQIQLNNPMALMKASQGGITGFAESYIAGDWDTPDLVAITDWAMVNEQRLDQLFTPGWFSKKIQRILHLLNNNSRTGSKRNIAAHYDLGNDFYRLWLDDTMTYSSALFSSEDESLEQAQMNKYNTVLDWLDASPEHSVLEIGCGWGGLSRALAQRVSGQYEGITLSKEQLAYVRGNSPSVVENNHRFNFMDYRDLSGQYDRVVSIEMLEAVGEKHWPTYFKKIKEVLKPGGTAVIQVITIDDSRFADYSSSADFIQRYIFPGGMLPSHEIMQKQINAAGLKLADSFAFGQDYARTLQMWSHRFNQHWSDIAATGFDESFHKLWNFYLAYCETGFKCGSIDVRFYKIRH